MHRLPPFELLIDKQCLTHIRYVISPGPIIIVGGYTSFGTTWTFSITTFFMLLPMLWLYILRKRIVDNSAKPVDDLPLTETQIAQTP